MVWKIFFSIFCWIFTAEANMFGLIPQRTSNFVQVSESYFTLEGRRFYFAGTNCYYVLTYSVEDGTRSQVLDVFDGMMELDLTVLRIWAFNDGDRWNALQPEPGVYSERVFRGLDWAVAEAGSRGIKLVMTLTNYFPDYGGMLQYVEWTTNSSKVDDFYSNEDCKILYKKFVEAVVNRVNTFTGIAYKDDPTIMAWELANEARYESKPGGRAMKKWVREMSKHIKAMDSNHLVTTGSEGFFGEGEGSSANPSSYFSTLGVVTNLQHSVSDIDYISAHIWPTQWLPDDSARAHRRFAKSWINAQSQLAISLSKPVVFGEFGYLPDGRVRKKFYRAVYNTVYKLASESQPVAGTNFWFLASPHYPDYDGYTIYPDLGRERSARKERNGASDSCRGCCKTSGRDCGACNDGQGLSALGKFVANFTQNQRLSVSKRLSPVLAKLCSKESTHSKDCKSLSTKTISEAGRLCLRTEQGVTSPGVLNQIKKNAQNMIALNVQA